MRQRTLPITALVVALFLLAANLLMTRWSARLPYREKLEDIRLAQAPNILFIGNSLLDGRVDATALKQGSGTPAVSLRPLNAALGGTEPHTQALLMDYSVRSHPELQTLVIGFFDFQLTAEDRVTPADLTGNAAVAIDPRFPLSEVDAVYHFTPLEDLQLRFLRAAPMVAYRKNAWKYVEILRRRMEQMGMPHEATNSNGRAADFSSLEAGTPAHFDDEVAESLQAPQPFNASYERIFAEGASRHLHVVMVAMPMSPEHRSTYYARPSWNAYWKLTRQRLQQRGFEVIDASDWMPSSTQFVDSLHMSPAAATEFSYRLGQQLQDLKLH